MGCWAHSRRSAWSELARRRSRPRRRRRKAALASSRASRSRSRTCSTLRACARHTARDVRRARPDARRRGGQAGTRGRRDPRRQDADARVHWGITSVNELLGSAHNPWALDRVSGGSSGGSAVAIAAGEVPFALGSDTGGSIRIPAAFCGIVGLKPTYGRISAARAWPLARSLDHPGPMASTPTGAALLLEAVAGVDDDDPSTVDTPVGDVQGELHRGLAGLVHRNVRGPASRPARRRRARGLR